MNSKMFFSLCCLLLVGCRQAVVDSSQDLTPPTAPPETGSADLPNPASAYCEAQGHKLEIRTAADGSQTGVCVFEDGSECDEWAFFRGECAPASQAATVTPVPTENPASLTVDPAEYQGWWTYTHPLYGFSLLLPPDWAVEQVSIADDPLLGGHLLNIHPQDSTQNLNLRMTFRRTDETDVLLWPTGVGSGEFIPQGTLEVSGGIARVSLFVCPGGQVQSVWFQGEEEANIRRGDLEFGFLYNYTNFFCQEGHSLEGEAQRTGLLIVASLHVP